MEKTWRTMTGLRENNYFTVLVLSIFIFLLGTLFLYSTAYADDAEASRLGATFTATTLVLDLPELVVEGTDLLYSTKLQLKQEGENFFLELIELGTSQYQEASIASAKMSADGMLHIPLLNIEGNFYNLDLQWSSSASLLPVKFTINMDTLANIPFENFDDDILGVSKKTCITICSPWGCFSICSTTTTSGGDEPKPKPYDAPYDY